MQPTGFAKTWIKIIFVSAFLYLSLSSAFNNNNNSSSNKTKMPLNSYDSGNYVSFSHAAT